MCRHPAQELSLPSALPARSRCGHPKWGWREWGHRPTSNSASCETNPPGAHRVASSSDAGGRACHPRGCERARPLLQRSRGAGPGAPAAEGPDRSHARAAELRSVAEGPGLPASPRHRPRCHAPTRLQGVLTWGTGALRPVSGMTISSLNQQSSVQVQLSHRLWSLLESPETRTKESPRQADKEIQGPGANTLPAGASHSSPTARPVGRRPPRRARTLGCCGLPPHTLTTDPVCPPLGKGTQHQHDRRCPGLDKLWTQQSARSEGRGTVAFHGGRQTGRCWGWPCQLSSVSRAARRVDGHCGDGWR